MEYGSLDGCLWNTWLLKTLGMNMNDLRMPFVFDFKDRQAQLMRQTLIKNVGQVIRGPINIASARELEAAGLVILKELDKGGILINVTPKGREAWFNFGLKAAGRQPVCLP